MLNIQSTGLLRVCYDATKRYEADTKMLRGSYECATRQLLKCYGVAMKVLQGNHESATRELRIFDQIK